jgi:uncharacterized protein
MDEIAMVSKNPASSDLTELGALLASSRIRPGCFSLSELDGFLAAIVVGPVWMSARAWLPLIWGEAEPEWLDEDEACRVRAAVQARYDQVARQLAEDADSYAPIFRILPDGTVAADDWARGFMAGTGLHRREWDPLFRNPQAKRFVVPITAQLTDWDEKLIADLGRDAVIAFRCKGREFIGYCAAEIGQFWAKRRQTSERRRDAGRQPMLI